MKSLVSRILRFLLLPSFGSALGLMITVTGQLLAHSQPLPDYYYYQKQKVRLDLDHERIAVRDQGHLSESERISAASRAGVSVASSEATGIDRWHVLRLQTPLADIREANTEIEKLVAAPEFEFVSPVFHGLESSRVIMTREVLARFKPAFVLNANAILSEVVPELNVLEQDFGSMTGAFRLRSEAQNGFEVLASANRLAVDDRLKWAEPNAQFTGSNVLILNDPGFSNLWGMQNTGQFGGTAGMDMDADLAWDIKLGSSNIQVLILDTGVQQDHPDINQLPANDFTGKGGGGGSLN